MNNHPQKNVVRPDSLDRMGNIDFTIPALILGSLVLGFVLGKIIK